MNIGGELIQISLGPGSNAITSHLCNLQGLACTTSPHSAAAAEHSSNNDPLCDPYITHAVQGETYVPRVLFVDGKNCFDSWSPSSRSGESRVNSGVGVGVGKATAGGNFRTTGDCHDTAASTALGPGLTWRGKVQVYHRQDASQAQSSMSSQEKLTTAPSSYNSNDQDQDHDPLMMGNGYNDKQYSDYYRYYSDQWNTNLSPGQRHAFDNFQQTASVLSPLSSANGNRMSRYHSGRYKGVSSQFVRNREHGNGDNDRVMKWDEQEEEEDDEWQDTEYAQRKIEEKNRRQEQYNQSLHCDLTNYWNEFLGVGDQAEFDTRERHYQNDAGAAESSSMPHVQEPSNGNDDDGIRREQGNQHPQDHPVRVGTSLDIARHNALSALNWMHYFMPPHPWNNMYSAPLPFGRCSFVKTRKDDIPSVQDKHHGQQQQQQKDQAMLYSYHAGMNPIASSSQSFCSMTEMSMGITREWRENVLSDKLRKWMEDCDCVKGFQILLDGDQAMFGGLAVSILEELSDECKSATKFSVVVHGGDDFLDGGMDMDMEMNVGGDAASELPYWRSENKAVRAFRNDLSQGLLLHGVTSNSDLVLPLSLTRCWKSLDKKDMLKSNLFEASAAAAMILETATLSFRFARGNPKTRSKIGIASGYFQGSSSLEDNDVFPTVDKLTFHEYISSLKPSSHRHVMTEMSCLAHPISPAQLHQSLLQGTSIERRQLEQERNSHRNTYYKRSRGRDIDPGIWMEDYGPNGGILTSLSPINGEFSSRSLHRHFALASSFRALPSTVGDIVSTYTTSLMEGGIIRHRPLSSIASVAGQSFGALTDPSTSCSAGSYWSTIFGSQETRTFQPLSVIGNTTRIYGHLSGTGNAFKTALSQKYKGYLRRDSMAGLVPELEDCEEAKESCLSLRDLYEPPMLGHELDEEGAYYDDNYG